MDIKRLENILSSISVQNVPNADVEVVNNTLMTMIGKGRQGAVFQYTNDICVKVFGNEEDCEREFYALSLGQNTTLLPRVYAKGKLYIAMEIIKGVDLREYLQSQPLTEELSAKLIDMLITFKKIGYERIDHHKRQIYLQEDGSLKVIDVARTVWRDRVYPYPRKLINSLGKEYKEVFLSHVQALSPDLYEEWQNFIRMEELSRHIYEIILKQKSDKKTLKILSEKNLIVDNEKKYVLQLEGLMYKVFKEEWIKTMLARGTDLEAVMEKIDDYWDKREQSFLKNYSVKEDSRKSEKSRKSEESGKREKSGKSRKSEDKRSRGYEGYRYEDRKGHNHHSKGKHDKDRKGHKHDKDRKGHKHDKDKKRHKK
ncbi:hypothetical protein [Neobacillus rhizophilus]|uniref:Serine/threonine protein kinase n=1 Tax=Neobacillus rhizophilus TaxID=2833579 RepID=A0A942U4D0_9BACI|nr:hypothetical protein [Neobacillus rhizophilus]MBS4211339.1 hypothetical protein [Neobacillus rhizophilus]MBU8916757.1 hypothetical protein [Bacillus sp. FJAT-29953]